MTLTCATCKPADMPCQISKECKRERRTIMLEDVDQTGTVVCHYCKIKLPIEKAWAKENKRGHKVYYCPEHYEKESRMWEKHGSNPY